MIGLLLGYWYANLFFGLHIDFNPDAEISSIRASGVRPDIKTSHSAKVNMSPLSVEHSVRDYFKNMDIDER